MPCMTTPSGHRFECSSLIICFCTSQLRSSSTASLTGEVASIQSSIRSDPGLEKHADKLRVATSMGAMPSAAIAEKRA